jgi:MFS family permease
MKMFYGWVIVGVGILVSCVGMGAIASLGVLLQPMSEATGWSRTGISTAALLSSLAMGVGGLLWGALSDRLGARVVVLTGGGLLGLGLVLASRVTELGQFQLAYGVLVGFAAAGILTPLTATTTRWFTRNRSLAVSLVTAGVSAGVMVTGPVAGWLVATYDWRTALLVLGGLVWLVVVPAALLLREAPVLPSSALSADGVEALGAGLSVGQALRTPQFIAIALTFFACCAAHSGPIFHMVSHAMDHGVAPMAAATVLSAASLASLSGKVLCGLFADRVGVKVVMVAGLALQAVAIDFYMFTTDLASFYAVSMVFGLAYGGVMPLYAVLIREYFGARIMGTLLGALGLAPTLGMALGPQLGGLVYDAFGSYGWMFIASSAIGLGAVAVALMVRPPAQSAVALPRLGVAH